VIQVLQTIAQNYTPTPAVLLATVFFLVLSYIAIDNYVGDQ